MDQLHTRRSTTFVGLIVIALTAALGAVAPYVPDLLAPLQHSPRWSWVPYLVGLLLTMYGPSLRRAVSDGSGDDDSPGGGSARVLPFSGKDLTRAASVLLAVVIVATTAACGLSPEQKAKARRALAAVAEQSARVEGLLLADATLPDQLFDQHLVDAALRDKIRAAIADAAPVAREFNAAAQELLSKDRLNFASLVPVASRLITRVRAVHALLPDGPAQRALADVEAALRIAANYFAVARADVRAAGYSDAQIAADAGVSFSPGQIDVIENYARGGSPTAAAGD